MLSCIRTVLFVAVAAVVLCLPTNHAAAGAEPPRDAILIVGDSLSAGFGIDLDQGWVALLQDRLEEKGYGYRVVNASISGDTTTGGLRRLPRAIAQHSPRIVVIELGGNDGLRGTPIDIIRDNLLRMIELARSAEAEVIVTGMLMPPNYGQNYAESFAGVYRDVADETGSAFIPFFMEQVALDPALMQPDGIHPNADGQPFLLEKVWTALEPKLES